MAKKKSSKKSSKSTIGLDKNIVAMLCYVGVWVTGLIFLLIEKDDKEIRFHAMQSLMAFGILTLVPFVPIVGWILSPLTMIASFIVWVVSVYKAYQGEKFKLPVVGNWAESQVKKMG